MSKFDNAKVIKTGTNTDVAYSVLSSVMGQLSDGIWENSPAMDKFWLFAEIGREADGEVTIRVSTDYADYKWSPRRPIQNGFTGMSDAQIRGWFARKIRAVVTCERKDDPAAGIKWDVRGEATLHYMRDYVHPWDSPDRITITDGFACAVAKRLASF